MVSKEEKKTNLFNKIKNISLIKVLQILLIVSITIKTLKNSHEKYYQKYYNLKKEELSKKFGSLIYEKMSDRLSLNKETFIERFETFIINNSHDSFYDMPLTPNGRKRELGRAGWTLLHNIAIKYPYFPTEKEKEDLKSFLILFGKLFPCEECRPHFKKMVNENPPNFEGHEKFNKWLYKVHNIVNKRIGNRIFDYNKLNKRWDCGCKVDY